MPQEMLEGVAKGGPRNGVKLSGPARWDGKVRKPLSKGNHNVTNPESTRVLFYQGHYAWKLVSAPPEFYYTWVWVSHHVEPQSKHKAHTPMAKNKHEW